ncbi:vegetative cell wall protein gp1-like [Dromiciops gliroides]|uniref:vegetative cell wall protein gp1-like n=1 Tax=Dromiciops gliroides TaxID=33562 RepID=UPI001CC5AFE3|nr:vegetative cell wall protein gp1-like [Dromiciops gliroides]
MPRAPASGKKEGGSGTPSPPPESTVMDPTPHPQFPTEEAERGNWNEFPPPRPPPPIRTQNLPPLHSRGKRGSRQCPHREGILVPMQPLPPSTPSPQPRLPGSPAPPLLPPHLPPLSIPSPASPSPSPPPPGSPKQLGVKQRKGLWLESAERESQRRPGSPAAALSPKGQAVRGPRAQQPFRSDLPKPQSRSGSPVPLQPCPAPRASSGSLRPQLTLGWRGRRAATWSRVRPSCPPFPRAEAEAEAECPLGSAPAARPAESVLGTEPRRWQWRRRRRRSALSQPGRSGAERAAAARLGAAGLAGAQHSAASRLRTQESEPEGAGEAAAAGIWVLARRPRAGKETESERKEGNGASGGRQRRSNSRRKMRLHTPHPGREQCKFALEVRGEAGVQQGFRAPF